MMMARGEEIVSDFGCERCWPTTADDAWQARNSLVTEHDLIDESYFHVMIQFCRDCSQRFVSVFTETVDWVDGDDPQYWTVLPITTEEAVQLVERGASLTEGEVHTLGSSRHCLQRDYPKGEAARSYWRLGVSVGRHD